MRGLAIGILAAAIAVSGATAAGARPSTRGGAHAGASAAKAGAAAKAPAPAPAPTPPPAPAPSPPAADAVTIALLPLATSKGFELYGQPVASELARALGAGGLDVVVVSAGAPVPSRARLVIDGTIGPGAGAGVALTARVRDPAKGSVVATLAASAPELTALDRAAADLSSRLLPAVRAQLAAQAAPPPPGHDVVAPPAHDPGHDGAAPPAHDAAPPRAALPAALGFGASAVSAFPDSAAAELVAQLVDRAGHRLAAGDPLAGGRLGGDWGLVVEIVGFDVARDGVPTARASARVRWITADGQVVADHVVRTDTVVGSRKDDRAAMVRRCVVALADILAPRVQAWSRSAR